MRCDAAPRFTLSAACRGWMVLAVLAFVPAWQAALAQSGGGPAWAELSAAEQHALEPLRGQWGSIDPERKAKWREVAGRYPSLTPDQQQRLRARMADWDGMSATQRSEARNRFRESSTQLPDSERRARWEAYQSLSPAQREALAARAAKRPGSSGTMGFDRQDSSSFGSRRPAEPPRALAPGIVQARPGASTRSLLQPAAPPRHQQPGLPKISATPGFVDSKTLLPKRGPQGAAAQPKQRKKDSRR
jgi:hypothetical protein